MKEVMYADVARLKWLSIWKERRAAEGTTAKVRLQQIWFTDANADIFNSKKYHKSGDQQPASWHAHAVSSFGTPRGFLTRFLIIIVF